MEAAPSVIMDPGAMVGLGIVAMPGTTKAAADAWPGEIMALDSIEGPNCWADPLVELDVIDRPDCIDCADPIGWLEIYRSVVDLPGISGIGNTAVIVCKPVLLELCLDVVACDGDWIEAVEPGMAAAVCWPVRIDDVCPDGLKDKAASGRLDVLACDGDLIEAVERGMVAEVCRPERMFEVAPLDRADVLPSADGLPDITGGGTNGIIVFPTRVDERLEMLVGPTDLPGAAVLSTAVDSPGATGMGGIGTVG
ncbi:MAG: hypothetical protein Q9213_005618 [Squamulea squamosa]